MTIATYPAIKPSFINNVRTGKNKYLKFTPETDVVLVSSELLKSQASIEWALGEVWSRVIIDEGHIIKDAKTATAKLVAQLKSLHRLIVTATPIMNKRAELVALLSAVGFKKRDLDTDDKVAAVTQSCSLQRTTDDLNRIKMTKLTYSILQAEYDDDERAVINAVGGSKKNRMAVMQGMRLVQFSPLAAFEVEPWAGVMKRLGLKRPDTSGPVIRRMVEHFMSLDKSRKAIIFTHFTYELKAIAEAFSKMNILSELLSGEFGADDKKNAVFSFINGSARLLIANIKCGGVGLNLQRASVVYVTTTDFNPFAEIQAIARSHRAGQTMDVEAVFVVASNEDGADIELKLRKMQYTKLRTASGMLRLIPKGSTHVGRLEDGKRDVEEQEAGEAIAKAAAKEAKDAAKADAKLARDANKAHTRAADKAARAADKAARAEEKRCNKRKPSEAAVGERKKSRDGDGFGGEEAISPPPEGAGSCAVGGAGEAAKKARGDKETKKTEKKAGKVKATRAAGGGGGSSGAGRGYVLFQVPPTLKEPAHCASKSMATFDQRPAESNSMISN